MTRLFITLLTYLLITHNETSSQYGAGMSMSGACLCIQAYCNGQDSLVNVWVKDRVRLGLTLPSITTRDVTHSFFIHQSWIVISLLA